MVALVVSGAAHCTALPFEVPRGFEVNDVDGEAAIPIDMVEQNEPPPPPPPPPAATATAEGEKEKAAAALAHVDAGARADAGYDGGPRDAGQDGPLDAGLDAPDLDGAAGTEGGLLAAADAGSPRDPEAIVGAAGSVQADVVLVMLVVNAEVIRQNPVGARMGFLLKGIPQWEEFMSGTDIDPVRDTDWVLISGPSLINTGRDVVLIHYAAPDSVVDRAVAVVSHKYDKGGPVDSGVRGVRATRIHADRAERILLRGPPRVLAVVPPSVADKVARQLATARVPAHVRPGEAVYLRLVNPHHPMPELPEAVSEMRLRVVPREDDGADVYIEGDTKDESSAHDSAAVVRQVIKRHDDPLTSLVTHGLLDHVEVSAEGPLVKVHLLATRDHIETLLALVAGFMGLEPPPAPSGSAAPAPPGSPAPGH
ncbi:MAG: hypothetical protein ACRENE_03345 [Polyangiaceae bacterium]